MKRLWGFGLLLISIIVHSADVYVWTDNKGVLHFSDTPDHPSAKLIKIATPTPVTHEITDINDPVNLSVERIQKKTNKTQAKSTTKVRITAPAHDATIRSNPGFIEVTGDINRNLDIGDKLQLLLDGKPYGAPKSNPYWSLKYIDRGTHTLTIQILQSGKVIASSDTITVHLHRTTVQ
ncbi:hypothetical protein BCU70_18210 [Vibrio sp. 10N.286.49.C2]|uniref:DUF4124 domain-containing protein n=1 Tax=unclassified Vibrio TaxID=2614977 RepID=UPI000C8211AF|nr:MULTISPECIES: DUF4124 domain-containing protein [unclassified Vibrio]PMH35554.1 hypothetical protein BCU70_18210 [Vibrio sp. 10N.286.49.C2]PMH49843.1 hypothetical protein BCU66_19580 [Vibrio sp. 10N.286.49.B1]PMH81779.1 hypothetical protein BCU58_02235 [Vibrio sp. 10N.286.48.B7]